MSAALMTNADSHSPLLPARRADDMYPAAVQFVTASGKTSPSSLESELNIGYNRAARLLETMALAGVVSPVDATGARTVLTLTTRPDRGTPTDPSGLTGDIANSLIPASESVLATNTKLQPAAQTELGAMPTALGRPLFKSAVVFALPEQFQLSTQELEEKLARRPLIECGPVAVQCSGWVHSSPLRRFVHTVGNQTLIALGTHKKLMPSSMLKQEIAKRAEIIAAEQGFPLGRKQMRELKDKVRVELLAKAPVVTSITRAWFDAERRLLVVEGSSAARPEMVVSVLRDCLGTFAATPLQTEQTPANTMARWLRTGEAPCGLTLDMDLELHAPSTGSVRYAQHALDGDDVKMHLDAGKAVLRLGLAFEDRVSFVVNAKLGLTRISFLSLVTKEEAAAVESRSEVPVGEAEKMGRESPPEEQFEADFLIMSEELGQAIAALARAFRVKLPGAASVVADTGEIRESYLALPLHR